MLGLGDESAYRGVDLGRVAQAFDFVETYPGGLGTAQIRTPRSPRPGEPAPLEDRLRHTS